MAELDLVDASHPDAQKVAVLEGPFDVRLAHAAIPEAGAGEVRVKIKWVGICGSDLEAYRGTRKPEFMSTPMRLGHEVGGVIDQVGAGVQGLTVGDKVTCRYVWGAFAEYIVCEPFNVKVMPESMALDEISLVEILPGVIHAADLCDIQHNSRVLITGQGVSGLILTQVISQYSPAALAVTDLKDRNLELARKYGATHTYKLPAADAPTMDTIGDDFPDGFDVVVPCLLEGDGMVDAVDCCTTGARIVMYGCIGVCNKPFDFFKVHRKRLEIYSTEPRRDIDMRRYFDESIRMLQDGLLNTREIVSERVPLSDIDRAFQLRDDQDNDVIHVLVDCEA